MAESHQHDAVVHAHDHMHVTHYHRPGEDLTHLVASHSHEHNHPALSHSHEPHEDMDKEHLREGHVHDHAHPSTSGRLVGAAAIRCLARKSSRARTRTR